MADLNFRITFVPRTVLSHRDKDDFLLEVNSVLQKCSITISDVSADYFQVRKTEDGDRSEIEELKIHVKCKPSFGTEERFRIYRSFCMEWSVHYDYSPKLRFLSYYIELYSNGSFVKYERVNHKLTYESIAFGVLPHNGKFYQFAKLKNKGFSWNVVEFYHDTRGVLIEYETFEIQFTYENIRNIFVNMSNFFAYLINKCNDDNDEVVSFEIYFDLFNPPIIFRSQNFKYRVNKYRNLNMESPKETCNFPHPPKISTDVLGRANVLCVTFHDINDVLKVLAAIHFQCSEKPVYFSSISTEQKPKPKDSTLETEMDFDCAYLLTAMFQRNFTLFSQSSNIEESLKKLYDMSQKNPKALEKALISVLSALDSGKILNYWNAIESQYVYYSSNKQEINSDDVVLPSNCSMIRSITVTPTRMLLWPKEVTTSNRILRKFDDDYSIRVSFREDNMSKFTSYPDIGVMESCVMDRLSNGICIGPRRYKFLAWSNSQIRDHGFWMYAKDKNGQTAETIRNWMGDFSNIHSVSKLMARIGQCLSQTEDPLSVPLKPHLVRTVKDIERGYDPVNKKPYCFSDGIGRISSRLAKQVREALGHDKLASAFQIRYGGYKGVLVEDPTLKDVDIEFRESMKKFDCPNSNKLEIVRTSAPIPLYLNRNIITLLNGLGVPHGIFLQLQEEMLKKLTDMLYEEEEAVEFLHSKIPTVKYCFEDLSESGIHLTTEPFFKALLLALHRHYIDKIKSKARIAIDPSKGRNMLGVLDETNTLKYGEVFVQYSEDISYRTTTRETVILQGEVLVTKNPCMHPGDIRKFKAVDVRSLHHIKDCIVFPQRGDRPHPNEMSGSDLDGDEYFVCWDSRLFFEGKNIKPAHFPAVNSRKISYITVDDMLEFFQDYMINDQVGKIANAYLAHAEKSGIFSPICKTLADKFSIAVDFPKNGKSVRLEQEERPDEYPDYMENARLPVFKARRSALGKMYRVCKEFESENQVISINYENITVDPDLLFSGWEEYRENALDSRNRYNALLRSILTKYGIQHEAEALSGAFTKLHCRFHERKDRYEVEKLMIGAIKKLHERMYEEFMEEFSSSGFFRKFFIRDLDDMYYAKLQKASAWYYVTYSDPQAQFLSFPWIVSELLYYIKEGYSSSEPLLFSPVITNFDKKIIECTDKNLLPDIGEIKIQDGYEILCSEDVLRRAFSTLVLWVKEQETFDLPKHESGELGMDVYVKLFLLVAENLGYIKRFSNNDEDTDGYSLLCLDFRKFFKLGEYFSWRNYDKNAQNYSAAQLCLEFLKFCSTFRFYKYHEMIKKFPFEIEKYNRLAKCAMFSYHKFALSGVFDSLNFGEIIDTETIVMKPVYINNSIFRDSPVSENSLEKAVKYLKKYSEVKELALREIDLTEKICVSATGSEKALRRLKIILRKDEDALRKLFANGVLPRSKSDCKLS